MISPLMGELQRSSPSDSLSAFMEPSLAANTTNPSPIAGVEIMAAPMLWCQLWLKLSESFSSVLLDRPSSLPSEVQSLAETILAAETHRRQRTIIIFNILILLEIIN